MNRLIEIYRAMHRQAFMPIFCREDFDSKAEVTWNLVADLLQGLYSAAVGFMGYSCLSDTNRVPQAPPRCKTQTSHRPAMGWL